MFDQWVQGQVEQLRWQVSNKMRYVVCSGLILSEVNAQTGEVKT
jgi:hypothetical protein